MADILIYASVIVPGFFLLLGVILSVVERSDTVHGLRKRISELENAVANLEIGMRSSDTPATTE